MRPEATNAYNCQRFLIINPSVKEFLVSLLDRSLTQTRYVNRSDKICESVRPSKNVCKVLLTLDVNAFNGMLDRPKDVHAVV